MILGFLGKGGSGKSSIATQLALWLHSNHKQVLAIDADHNMDLAHNLFGANIPEGMPYFGSKILEIGEHVGLNNDQRYDQAFLDLTEQRFSLAPPDPITKNLSVETSTGMHVMAAGPQTNKVLYGESCSHSLTTPLKIYLPLLELSESQFAVVDEKAGADGVSTGIVTGLDVGIIVCEPALHSTKTALQIAELMDFYETPYLFVANKIQSSDDKDFVTVELGQEPITFLLESRGLRRNPYIPITEYADEMQAIVEHAQSLNQNNRIERTIKKFQRNYDFSS